MGQMHDPNPMTARELGQLLLNAAAEYPENDVPVFIGSGELRPAGDEALTPIVDAEALAIDSNGWTGPLVWLNYK